MSAQRRRLAACVADAAGLARRWRAARNMLLMLAVVGFAMPVARGQPRADHGSSDVYAAPGIGIVWGIERGPSDAEAVVVIRIVTDPATYPWLAVRGVNPFSGADTPLLPPTPMERSVDV